MKLAAQKTSALWICWDALHIYIVAPRPPFSKKGGGPDRKKMVTEETAEIRVVACETGIAENEASRANAPPGAGAGDVFRGTKTFIIKIFCGNNGRRSCVFCCFRS